MHFPSSTPGSEGLISPEIDEQTETSRLGVLADVSAHDAGSTPTGVDDGMHYTDAQLATANERERIVLQCIALRDKGVSLRSMMLHLHYPIACLSVWIRAYEREGLLGLIPGKSTGRPRNFNLTADETARLQRLHLEKGSFPLAVEWFAKDAACRPATRALIGHYLDEAAHQKKEVRWPISLKRAAHVSEEAKAMFRGEKAFGQMSTCERRGLVWIDRDGSEQMMLPNSIWESDDMSSNQPFRWSDPESGEQRIGRQTLCTLDVFSGRWLGVSPVGRERDAYRAEDIADHMRATVEAHGLPLIWRLERGSWESHVVEGIDIDVNGKVQKWGDLNPICKIVHTWTSRGKGTIETSFNHLQNILAHTALDIGRFRGEFEEATRILMAAHRGNEDAWKKFWHIAQCADGFEQAMAIFNAGPKIRRAHGKAPVVADDLYATAKRREVPAGEWWRFSPVKRMATVRQSVVEVAVQHYPMSFRFRVNGVQDGLHLEHGHRVLVAFHPGRPEEGCHVFNAEGYSSTRNRSGIPIGQRLLIAPLAEDAPQLNLSKDELAFAARRNANAAVRTEFRAIVPPGTRRHTASMVRSQYGDSAESRSTPRPVDAESDQLSVVSGQSASVPSVPLVAPKRATKPATTDTEADDLAAIERLEREAAAAGNFY